MGASGRAEGKMERLVKLTLLLREKAPLTFREIRRELPLDYPAAPAADDADGAGRRRAEESVRRRFERDKADLKSCGIEIASLEENRYAIDEEASFSAPLELDSTEESLIRCLCAAAMADSNYPFQEEIRLVLAKMGDELGVPDLMPEGAGEAAGAGTAGQARTLDKVFTALYERHRLGFTYRDSSGRVTVRVVEPFGFFCHERAAYVVAWDPEADGERTFRVDRMEGVSVSDGARFAERAFDVRAYCRKPFQYGGEAIEARVHIDSSRAGDVGRLCAGTGVLEETADGWTWEVEAAGAGALAKWCVEEGPGIGIEEPAEARRVLAEGLAEAMAAGGDASGAADAPVVTGASGTAGGVTGTGEAAGGDGAAGGAAGGADSRYAMRNAGRSAGESAATSSVKRDGAPRKDKGARGPRLHRGRLLLALFAQLEGEGAVSIPMSSRMYGNSEDEVRDALVQLIFCYDAVGARLDVRENYAKLEVPSESRVLRLSRREADVLLELLGESGEPAEGSLAAKLLAAKGPVGGGSEGGRRIRTTPETPTPASRDETLRTLSLACEDINHHHLRIAYRKEGDAHATERVVEPRAIASRGGKRYLCAWCLSSGGWRDFRVDRILSAEMLESTFEPRADTPGARGTSEVEPPMAVVAFCAGTPLPEWPGLKVVRDASGGAPGGAEGAAGGAADGESGRAKSGETVAVLPWYGTSWLPRHIAACFGTARAIEPPELASEVVRIAGKMLERA